MPGVEISQTAEHWFVVILVWIGFGTVAGLLARIVLPGRDPSGTIGTMVIGIAGSTLGLLAFYHFVLGSPKHPSFNPISPLGMLAAAVGALALLIAYRLVAACVRIDQPPEPPKEEAKQ